MGQVMVSESSPRAVSHHEQKYIYLYLYLYAGRSAIRQVVCTLKSFVESRPELARYKYDAGQGYTEKKIDTPLFSESQTGGGYTKTKYVNTNLEKKC